MSPQGNGFLRDESRTLACVTDHGSSKESTEKKKKERYLWKMLGDNAKLVVEEVVRRVVKATQVRKLRKKTNRKPP